MRREHPKKYLKYLCREAAPHEFCSTYRETEGGAHALAGLDWTRLLDAQRSAPFLRAISPMRARRSCHWPSLVIRSRKWLMLLRDR